jgi:hypothetical protein
MPKGRVRIREVPYKVIVEDALGGQSIQYDTAYGPGWPANLPTERLAREPDLDPEVADEEYRLGQVVEFMNDDYVRLSNAGAIVGVDKQTTQVLENQNAQAQEGFGSKSVEELEQWIREDKPTVNEVVAASNGDHDTAMRLLEAESNAQDGDPRKGVVDGLQSVMARA